ncbi:MAG: bifunctional proline dehydrogenase/L-glutamate gamma-semialdehyde dehydrogenase PutA, partial [Pseudomonadota bacterium]
RTRADADKYFAAYKAAIATIGKAAAGRGPVDGPGISVKLSALHPRYSFAQRDRCVPELTQKLLELAIDCAKADIGLTVDAEEADRLEPSLDIIAAVAAAPELGDWGGFGLAIQAYQRRALPVVEGVIGLARRTGRRLMVRLVKGAYWDSEIKWAQEAGLESFPVFTRKASTDVSYLACARRLLAARDVVYPQFATHNAHTVAWIREKAGTIDGFEFQRLHGMGEPLYHSIVEAPTDGAVGCRVYAPVGGHRDLLPYLVRRLLENGANTSFVHRIRDDGRPITDVISDPVDVTTTRASKPHPLIRAPGDLFAPDRQNSSGLDLSDPVAVEVLRESLHKNTPRDIAAGSIVNGVVHRPASESPVEVVNPANRKETIGTIVEADGATVEKAISSAIQGFDDWNATPVDQRAAVLDRVADLYETNRPKLMALAIREAGKTIPDAVAEVREAVDFCRYYAKVAREELHRQDLPGPTGETNTLQLGGRGVFACISPWNFPLAIFTGQIAGALITGNAVIAKPAEQTPLIAHCAVTLMHEAGVPPNALHLLPGRGETVGQTLCNDERVAGIAFTGSMVTAQIINRALASRSGPIVPLIAETGGLNAMIVDSSALAEQVCDDVIASGFQSAGQRCSALRVLFIPREVGDGMVEMLTGAMDDLVLGDPMDLETDIGPVIDKEAASMLSDHCDAMDRDAKRLARSPLNGGVSDGTFFPPTLYEIDSLDRLKG